MSQLMRPRSIAVLGASTDPTKFANRPLAYLRNLQFEGPVYPIHPQASEIAGFHCFRSLDDITEPIDVVVIARPAAQVPMEVERCLNRGIRAFVVFSAGFAEAGPEGARLQQELADLCNEAGAVLCGPNCTGIVDTESRATLSFMSNLDSELTAAGSVALVSGSGSIAAMMYQGRGPLFRSVASIGNEAVTTAADFIADAVEQAPVSGVVAFLEAIRDPHTMKQALQRASVLAKPVAILKGGRSARSAEVAATHTGALIDDDTATQAMFDACNAIRADSIEELKVLAALMHAASSRTIGPKIGVLTPSGGTAVLIVDEIARHGLELPGLSAATGAALQQLIPQSTPANPMDITGFGANSPQVFSAAITTMLGDPAVDLLLVPMGGGVGKVGSARAQSLIEAGKRSTKLLVPIWQGTTREQPGYDALLAAGLPVMTDYALLVGALGKLVRHRLRSQRPQQAAQAGPELLPQAALDLLQAARQSSATALNEPDVKAIFAAAGIRVPQGHVVKPGQANPEVPFPVVLKIASADLTHKSEVGGVAIVHQSSQLQPAIESMAAQVRSRAPDASIDGFLVEEMITGGLELMIGIKRDARYGALLSLGLGGTWANSLGGAVAALLPIDRDGARALVHRFFTKLEDQGAEDALCSVLLKLSAMSECLADRLDVLEVNPIRLFGGKLADAAADVAAHVVALDGVLTLSGIADQ